MKDVRSRERGTRAAVSRDARLAPTTHTQARRALPRNKPAGIVVLQEKVELRMRHGGSIDDVDTEIIEPSALNSDEKAALWLYAWSCLPSRKQRRSAESLVQMLAVAAE